MITRFSAAALTFVIATACSFGAPNLLIITVDDMNCDSVGVYGCPLTDITPNMDKLASEGIRFEMAHVQVGNCYPSRNVMFSGRFPHSSGVEGFYQVRDIKFPVMCDVMQKAGYYVGIRGKVSHSTPYQPYRWDNDLTKTPEGRQENIKDVPSYYRSTKRGIENAEKAGKPFVINVNISDPHKPFWKPSDQQTADKKASKVYSSEDVPVPGFLWDDGVVRQELALYYNSVSRADDAVGAVLKALDESGKSDETVVMFLSDHGMPLPFAKTQLYHHSTRTPWMVRWPGVVKPGSVDGDHMISAVDMLPTLCEIVGTEIPQGVEGRSFLPLIKGEKQDNRGFVIKEYNENAGGNRHPIRGVQTAEYLYLFNPWSDGTRRFKTATQGTSTYRQMVKLAKTDSKIAARLDLFDHRVVEELYDVMTDPDCLNNLVKSPEHADDLAALHRILGEWMKETNDPLLEAFNHRDNSKKLDELMTAIEDVAEKRRSERRRIKKDGNPKGKGKSNAKKNKKKSQ